MDLLVYFWPQKWQKMARFSCENLQMLEAFSIFLGGGVSQNAPIISSIIFNFWLITSVILILKCALKAPKNDVLKTISSQIILRISVENPPRRKIEKPSRICKFSLENPAIFCHFWGQKYTNKSINFLFFGLIFCFKKGFELQFCCLSAE